MTELLSCIRVHTLELTIDVNYGNVESIQWITSFWMTSKLFMISRKVYAQEDISAKYMAPQWTKPVSVIAFSRLVDKVQSSKLVDTKMRIKNRAPNSNLGSLQLNCNKNKN